MGNGPIGIYEGTNMAQQNWSITRVKGLKYSCIIYKAVRPTTGSAERVYSREARAAEVRTHEVDTRLVGPD